MNRKSIQILRGSETYDPGVSSEILLDGQPFYSKKTKKLYIGDGVSKLSQLSGTEIGLDLSSVVSVNGQENKLTYANNGVSELVSIDMLDIPEVQLSSDNEGLKNKVLTLLSTNEIGWAENHVMIEVSNINKTTIDSVDIYYPTINTDTWEQIRAQHVHGVTIRLRYDDKAGLFKDWSVLYCYTGTSGYGYLITILCDNAIIQYVDNNVTIYPLLSKEALDTKLAKKADIYPEMPDSGVAKVQVRNNYYGEDRVEFFDIKVSPTPWTVARRDTNGAVEVADAMKDTDAMNRRMVASAISESHKVTKPSQTNNGNASVTNGITIDTTIIRSTDMILVYTTYGKLCFVNYAFTALSDITSGNIQIATGMPKAYSEQYFSCVSYNSSETGNLVNFRVTTDGRITTYYGAMFKKNHFVKGGFVYITQ